MRLVRIGTVVMYRKRIDLLERLGQGERTIEALAQATGPKLVSVHLQVRRKARLVVTRRDVRNYCRAAEEEVSYFVGALGRLAVPAWPSSIRC